MRRDARTHAACTLALAYCTALTKVADATALILVEPATVKPALPAIETFHAPAGASALLAICIQAKGGCRRWVSARHFHFWGKRGGSIIEVNSAQLCEQRKIMFFII